MFPPSRLTAAAVALAAFLPAASPAAAQTAPVAEVTVVVAEPGEPSGMKIKLTDVLVSSVTAGSSREPARLELALRTDEPVAILLPAVQKLGEYIR